MSRKCTTQWCVEIDEALDYGMSTKYIAARLGISEEILLEVIKEKREQRDGWQNIIDETYKNKNILER